MSDQIEQQLLARVAKMEQELAGYRAQSRQPAAPAQDPNAWVRQLIADPVGVMTRHGIPVDHVTRAGVAHVMGDQAPEQIRMAAQMGPALAQTRDLASGVESISRRLDAMDQQAKTMSTRDSLKKLAADKAKYPHLAKAYAADPSLFESDVISHKGSAEDLASAIETRQKQMYAALGLKLDAQPASGENAEKKDEQAQSAQGKPAMAGTMNEVPPPSQPKVGSFTKSDHEQLKEEILRKYNLQ